MVHAAACAALLNNEMWEPKLTDFLQLVVTEMQSHGSSALSFLKASTAKRVFHQVADAIDDLRQSVEANRKRTCEQAESLAREQVYFLPV